MIPTALTVQAGTVIPDRRILWSAIQTLLLNGISCSHTRRAYGQALDEFLIWLCSDESQRFTKAAVQKYRVELQSKGLSPSSINVRMSAIRKLAGESADNGLLRPEIAAGIARVKGVKRSGVRLGNWLSIDEAEALPIAFHHFVHGISSGARYRGNDRA